MTSLLIRVKFSGGRSVIEVVLLFVWDRFDIDFRSNTDNSVEEVTPIPSYDSRVVIITQEISVKLFTAAPVLQKRSSNPPFPPLRLFLPVHVSIAILITEKKGFFVPFRNLFFSLRCQYFQDVTSLTFFLWRFHTLSVRTSNEVDFLVFDMFFRHTQQ